MDAGKDKRRRALSGLAAFFLLAGVAGWILWKFPPERYGFYPACPIREYLHIECPGCGATRAIAALLHGHFTEALRLNGLVVGIVLPLAAIYAVVGCVRYLREENFRWPEVPRLATFTLLGLAAVFTLARNL